MKCSLSLFISIIVLLTSCKMPEGPLKPSGDVTEATGWSVETIVDGLEHPWAVAWISEEDMLITERPGRLRLVTDGILQPEPITGVPAVFADGQGGLLDIALHPNFEENHVIFLTYAAGDKDENRTTVARGVLSDHALTDVQVIFETNVTKRGNQHFGSRMLWLPDGTLLVSIADGGNYIRFKEGGWIREQAQNTRNHLGSVVNITEDGHPTPNGPFVNQAEALPEIWSFGHRNIQGLALDTETGNIWANEHGARGGDELNLLSPGGNFGWPVVTYSREYHFPRITRKTTKHGMVDPTLVWSPAQAPSGLVVYSGDVFPEWQGNLFSGGLRSGEIRRIILENTSVIGEEKLTIGARVRDVRQGPDGYIYLLTDEANGRLLKVVRG